MRRILGFGCFIFAILFAVWAGVSQVAKLNPPPTSTPNWQPIPPGPTARPQVDLPTHIPEATEAAGSGGAVVACVDERSCKPKRAHRAGLSQSAADPVPTLGAAADQADADCKERMRKLGVISNGPCVDVSDIVEKLATGTYAFNKPDSAYVDTPFHIGLVLKTSPKQRAVPLLQGLPGQIAEREGKFAQSLEATLHGNDLTVDPEGAQARTATTAEPVTWEWTVTPKSDGEKTLILDVVADIKAGSDSHKVQIKTLREPIVVRVTGFQRIREFVSGTNSFVLGFAATISAFAGLVSYWPSIRKTISRWGQKRPKKRSGTR
jgi:hypothetical protein